MNLSNIKLIATDCDGVLTDGGMYFLDSGDEFKRFSVLDGIAFILLRKHEIKTAVITNSKNQSIRLRAEKLGVDELIMGTEDKLAALIDICTKYNIPLSQAAYIGDDIYDIPAIKSCGFGCVPNNALDYIKKEADYITKRNGGDGCFREVADLLISYK